MPTVKAGSPREAETHGASEAETRNWHGVTSASFYWQKKVTGLMGATVESTTESHGKDQGEDTSTPCQGSMRSMVCELLELPLSPAIARRQAPALHPSQRCSSPLLQSPSCQFMGTPAVSTHIMSRPG